MKFKKEVYQMFEAVADNALSFTKALFKLQNRIRDLEAENKMLREFLNAEIVEETVEGEITRKFIRKIK